MHRDDGIGSMAMGEEPLSGSVSWPFIPGWSQASQAHWHLGASGTYTLSFIKTQQTHLCGHSKISSSLNHSVSLFLSVCLSKVICQANGAFVLLLPGGSLWGFGKGLLIYCVQHDPVFCSGLIWSNFMELGAPICDEDFSVMLSRIHLDKDWSLSCCSHACSYSFPSLDVPTPDW